MGADLDLSQVNSLVQSIVCDMLPIYGPVSTCFRTPNEEEDFVAHRARDIAGTMTSSPLFAQRLILKPVSGAHKEANRAFDLTLGRGRRSNRSWLREM